MLGPTHTMEITIVDDDSIHMLMTTQQKLKKKQQ